MIAWLAAALTLLAFIALLKTFKTFELARGAFMSSRQALSVLRDPALDDDAKERAMQRQAGDLFRAFALVTGGAVLALGLPLLVIAGLDHLEVLSLERFWAVTLSPAFLLSTLIAGGLIWRFQRRS
ncbi:MAG: hypothetical protein ACFB6S_19995 [Geminicoccaceae bacterium]